MSSVNPWDYIVCAEECKCKYALNFSDIEDKIPGVTVQQEGQPSILERIRNVVLGLIASFGTGLLMSDAVNPTQNQEQIPARRDDFPAILNVKNPFDREKLGIALDTDDATILEADTAAFFDGNVLNISLPVQV